MYIAISQSVPSTKERTVKIWMFTPAFNVVTTIATLLCEFDDVVQILARRGDILQLTVLDDASTDGTTPFLAEAKLRYSWLTVTHNEKRLGNAQNIVTGYMLCVNDSDVVGCLDADGEHSPYAIPRHLEHIRSGAYQGVAGSIIFPEHDSENCDDRNMMRFYGGMQSTEAGIDGRFYIQSPGYNLHRSDAARRMLILLPIYKKFFLEKNQTPFPYWGMHGVIIHLLARGAGAKIKALYLECFGASPNRDPQKLLLQSQAAQLHLFTLKEFIPEALNVIPRP